MGSGEAVHPDSPIEGSSAYPHRIAAQAWPICGKKPGERTGGCKGFEVDLLFFFIEPQLFLLLIWIQDYLREFIPVQ